MTKFRSVCLAMLGALGTTISVVSAATAEPGLVAPRVVVVRPTNVAANVWGSVLTPDEISVPGLARIDQDGSASPTITLLGCEFDISTASDSFFETASPVLARKLLSGDAHGSGAGRLINPRAVGVLDPLTVISCENTLTYYFFLYRRTPAFGELIVEALVFEYDEAGRLLFEGRSFDANYGEKPSLQVANAISNARNLFKIEFRTPNDAASAANEREKFWRSLLSLNPLDGLSTLIR